MSCVTYYYTPLCNDTEKDMAANVSNSANTDTSTNEDMKLNGFTFDEQTNDAEHDMPATNANSAKRDTSTNKDKKPEGFKYDGITYPTYMDMCHAKRQRLHYHMKNMGLLRAKVALDDAVLDQKHSAAS